MSKIKILVAGLAGASLGTEIVKCLYATGSYMIFGCDISPLAYGLFSEKLHHYFVADSKDYINSILEYAKKHQIEYIIPGGEEPMRILSSSQSILESNLIKLVCNNSDIVSLFSDKRSTFDFLKSHNIPVPSTFDIECVDEALENIDFPCIIKPSVGTGGSDSVFFATNLGECLSYVEILRKNGRKGIIQEYIGHEEGEFTIGVLSDKESNCISSVGMMRLFNSKLSIAYKSKYGLISSGYSQGLISDFSSIRKQAEEIALLSGSTGPLNIQGRLRDGILYPFEINPRFSASTYLRAMAGINEVDIYIKYLHTGFYNKNYAIIEGYYLRSFEEKFIRKND